MIKLVLAETDIKSKGKVFMKTKTMKKMLSLFLAVLMIALAIPFTLLTVGAEDSLIKSASITLTSGTTNDENERAYGSVAGMIDGDVDGPDGERYYQSKHINADDKYYSLVNGKFVRDTSAVHDYYGYAKFELTSEISLESMTAASNSEVRLINGVPLEKYTIVYNSDDVDYSKRAAEYISEQIKVRTSVELVVKEDDEGNFAHEIVVGETARDISKKLEAPKKNTTEFAILADDNHIALEGDYFVIAAAAYFFVETYVAGEYFDAQIPKETCVHEPIVKEAKNYILLIGDGMGVVQTLLFDVMKDENIGNKAYSDGEDIFYGYLLPNQGLSRTNSLSGVTDSSAGGTALASGHKTYNNYVGKDKLLNDVQSLTELAGSLGKATAVMSTEAATGATPASFSAHANDRNDKSVISASQLVLKNKYGTIIECDYNYYDLSGVDKIQNKVTTTLNALSKNQNGFFLMYEEAHIDKHCHNQDINSTFDAIVRFNQVIGVVMEYAFYNPETFVLITADHETGGLTYSGGKAMYTSGGNHTGKDVPVFAYGIGTEKFNEEIVENVEIPKAIAALWGVERFGQ